MRKNKKQMIPGRGFSWREIIGKYLLMCWVVLCVNLLLVSVGRCQDGAAGINEATNKVKSYFDAGCNLMYAIGAVVGVVGAIKVLCAMN